jgi:hypothetical protein
MMPQRLHHCRRRYGRQRVAGSTVTTRYFHTDNLGSISITNETGAVVEHNRYDAVKRHRDSSH